MEVTRKSILETLKECKKLGEEMFLKKYGFGKSTLYKLSWNGWEFPSKAILGVAAGKTAKEFSGGMSYAVRILVRLGFKIVKKISEKIKSYIAIASAVILPFACLAVPRNLPVPPANVFNSGLTNPGHIEGSVHVGLGIGVAADHCSPRTEKALKDILLGTDVQLFLDSGAFSEVKFDPYRIAHPISDEEWEKRIDLYYRLASYFGDQIHLVAPDMVGNQSVTLQRMNKYADYMVGLMWMGARLLVPCQKGDLNQVDFFYEACKILGVNPEDVMPALPCKNAATTPEELTEFVKTVQPNQLHLLGMGARNQKILSYLNPIKEHSPDTMVQLDSCLIRANVGREEKLGKLTMCLDYAAEITGDKSMNEKADRNTLAILMAFGRCSRFDPTQSKIINLNAQQKVA